MSGRSDGSDGRKPGTFLPGVSGNLAGRPKGTLSLRTLLKQQLEKVAHDEDGRELTLEDGSTPKTYAQGIVEATLRDALKGDASARRLVWEYIDGKAPADPESGGEGVVAIVDDVPEQ